MRNKTYGLSFVVISLWTSGWKLDTKKKYARKIPEERKALEIPTLASEGDCCSDRTIIQESRGSYTASSFSPWNNGSRLTIGLKCNKTKNVLTIVIEHDWYEHTYTPY